MLFKIKNNGHKNSNNSHNYHDEIELYQGNNKRNIQWHSTPKKCTPKSQSYILWCGSAETWIKCHMVPIYILWCREFWTTQPKYTFETRQKEKQYHIIQHTVMHGHNQLLVCICLLEGSYFNYLECSYDTWYVYYNKLSIWTRTMAVSRKHINQLIYCHICSKGVVISIISNSVFLLSLQ